MSSRALRKLQREQEQKKQELEQPQHSLSQDEDDDEVQDSALGYQKKKAFNAFDMLNEGGEQDGSDHDLPDEEETAFEQTKESNGRPIQDNSVNTKAKSGKKRKKKNKAGKEKVETLKEPSTNGQQAEPQDEIDAALASLSMKSQDGSYAIANVKQDNSKLQLYRLLGLESKHLNAVNEMKRLFGNIMSEDENSSPDRRRGRGPQQLDLGAALTARYSPISKGQGLSGLALRRNVFMHGKEEWPKATSGGLGMELDEKDRDGVKYFRFVHNTAYQDVQRQFESCVESMDPQRVVSMLQFNPYHISTLLQVSEIAKQQGDHSVSGDLLERALFSFGRSVQSSFSNALAEGKARLDFRRPENREFWLAAWRYIANLGQRGTWRTAYEWAKLLLSLDPIEDPYSTMLIIDQLALRGGQAEHFLDLTSNAAFMKHHASRHPNLVISTGLAEYKLKHPRDCRSTLKGAVSFYPWIFARLLKELNIEHIPPSIWGKEARTARERFDSEIYVLGAKDLWNTPETIQLLVEVVESASPSSASPPLLNHPITLNEARHVLLSGNPQLITLLPRTFTTISSSASDPLPPPDNLESYSTAPPQTLRPPPGNAYTDPFDSDDAPSPIDSRPVSPNPAPGAPEPSTRGIRDFFSRLMAWPNPNADPPPLAPDTEPQPNSDDSTYADYIAEQSRVPLQPTVDSDSSDEAQQESAYDEDRNKRWLAGLGLQAVKAFVAEHGSDESQWEEEAAVAAVGGQNVVRVYAVRVKLLQEVNRRFIMDYALPQGAGREVSECVARIMRGR